MPAYYYVSQGFGGKRSNAVGMKRPKKAKVAVANDDEHSTSSASTGTPAIEEGSASTDIEEDAGSHVDSQETLRKEEKGILTQLRKLVQDSKVLVRKAEAALKHEERLEEEREKRWWSAERRDESPPAYLQLERAYKSKVKDLKARLALSEAETRVADNETKLQEWLVHLAELKYDRLQEKLLALL